MMKGDKTILWRMIIFSMSLTIVPVSGQFSLNVRLLSYHNPLHAAAEHHGDCCDKPGTMDPPNCSSPCDNEFQFSLVIGGTGTIVGQFLTEVIQRNNDDLVFSPGEGSMLGGVPNPVVFEGLNSSILEYLELNIAVFDDDYSTGPDFIDSITISFENIFLSTVSFTAPSVHGGEYGFAEATLSFGLECSENYFGENCTIFCIDTDSDSDGHFICDDMGNRVCREGYSNPSNGCIEPTSTMRCGGCSEDKTMVYIIIIAIMAAISILMIPTTAVVTVALMKLRQRKLNCKSSGGMKMEGNPSYATAQTDHSAMHNDIDSSTHHCNTTGKRYFTNRRNNESYCQAYAVSTLSLGTLETSVEVEGARAFSDSEESAYYSKASISPCSDNTTVDGLGGEGIHVSQSEQDGYEDVWEFDERNYASLKRVGTNAHDNDTACRIAL